MGDIFIDIERIHAASMSTENWNDLERRVLDKKDPLISREYIRHLFFTDKERLILTVAGANTLVTGAQRALPAAPVHDAVTLPATVVQAKGRTYHIHGISHSLTHRKMVREQLGRRHNAIFESGLTLIYASHAVEHPRYDELKYVGTADAILAMLAPAMVIPNLQELDPRTWFRKKTLDDVMDYRRMDLPGDPSRGCDMSQIILPSHLAHNWIRYTLDDRVNRAILLRSLAQAEYARKTTRCMSMEEMHLLVGLGHERHIAYFLENQERVGEIAAANRPHSGIRRAYRTMRTLAVPLMALFPLEEMDEYGISLARAYAHGVPMEYLATQNNILGIGISALFTAGFAFIFYRKNRALFTNGTYIRALLSPNRMPQETR